MLLRMVLLTGVVPAAVTFVGLLLVWRLNLVKPKLPILWANGIIVAVGYCIGHALAQGLPSSLPATTAEWLPLLSLAAALLSIVDAKWQPPSLWVKGLWRLAFSLVVSWLLVFPARSFLGVGKAIAWVVVVAVLMALVWTVLHWQAERQTGAMVPFAMTMLSFAASASLVIGHTAAISQLAGVLAAVMGATFVLGLLNLSFSVASGITAVFVTLLVGTVTDGMFFAHLPAFTGLVLIAAPMALTVANLPAISRLPRWQQRAAQLFALLLPLIVGVGWAIYQLGLPQL